MGRALMATRGELIIARGHTFLGHGENPAGSNSDHGGPVDACQKRYGLSHQPWCNCWVGWVIATTPGIGQGYKNGARAIISPATQTTWDRASKHGWAHADGRNAPVGSMFIRPGTHIGFVAKQLGNGTFVSLEGNHSDAVATATRSWDDWKCIVIPGTGKHAPGKGHAVNIKGHGPAEHGGKTT